VSLVSIRQCSHGVAKDFHVEIHSCQWVRYFIRCYYYSSLLLLLL
jgi:hypothetical protein